MITNNLKHKFFSSLTSYYESGIPIQEIFSMRGHRNNILFKSLTPYIKDGSTLAESMHKSELFNSLEVGLVRIGEETGRQPQVFKHLADHLHTLITARKTTTAGLILPILYVHAAAFILPVVALFKGELTMVTYLLQAFSVIGIMWIAAGIVFIVLPWLISVNKIPEAVMSLIPFIGKYYKRSHHAQFLSTMSMALDSGIPMISALKTASDSCGVPKLQREIQTALHEIDKTGEKLSCYCESFGLDNETLCLVETGEQTGALPEKLSIAAKEYYLKNTQMIKTSSVIVPFLIYGAVALFIAYSIIQGYSAYYSELDEIMNSM